MKPLLATLLLLLPLSSCIFPPGYPDSAFKAEAARDDAVCRSLFPYLSDPYIDCRTKQSTLHPYIPDPAP